MTTRKILFLTVVATLTVFTAGELLAQGTPPAIPVTQPTPAAAGTLRALHGETLTYFSILTLVVGYLATTLIGLFGFVILWRMLTGKIDIRLLISESDGAASLSRFQFLVFTYVISLSLLLVILGAENGPAFPDKIPVGIYALLGISAASYVVSKGIQANAEKDKADDYRVPLDNENAG